MVVNRSKKSVRYRGQTKHGGGRKSRCRSAGNRGGRGASNKYKRGQSRKPSFREEISGARRTGFKYHGDGVKKNVVAVTLAVIQQRADGLISAGKAKKGKDMIEIDVSVLDANKVLATGNVTKKMKVIADVFTPNAVEKLKAAGGEAVTRGDAPAEKSE